MSLSVNESNVTELLSCKPENARAHHHGDQDIDVPVSNVAYGLSMNHSQLVAAQTNVVSALSPKSTQLKPSSDSKSSMSQNLSAYLESQSSSRSKETLNNGQYAVIELKHLDLSREQPSTDPVTGYSSLMRPDKGQLSSQNQDVHYDPEYAKFTHCHNAQRLRDGGVKLIAEDSQSDFHNQTALVSANVSHTVSLSEYTLKCPNKEVSVISVSDVESGYCLLKDTRPQPPSDSSALYGTLNFKANDSSSSLATN